MNEPVIKVSGVTKIYNIRERGYRSFRDSFSRSVNRFMQKLGRKNQDNVLSDTDNNVIHALDNVSFEVKKGEALGIIGANGSGKTTTLRLLSKVTAPTEGNIEIIGKVAPLIQVGAGFHPELTGRENVYLNAAIMGLTRKEVDERYDDIVSFAELDGFMDTPVKRYSSGMYVRLGFAVVANIDPDIFLIDEILSVGDLSFQRKCLDTMSRIRRTDKAIVFVSHNLSAVKGLCDRVIWLDNGKIKKEGDPGDVISAYTTFMTSKSEFVHDISYTGGRTRWGTGEVRFRDVRVTNEQNKERKSFHVGDNVCVEAAYESYHTIESPMFWIGILNAEQNWVTGFVLNDATVGERIKLQGKGRIKCQFEAHHLYPGSYYIVAGVFDRFRTIAYDRMGNACDFEIVADECARKDYRPPHWKGVIDLPHKWEYEF